MGEEGVDLGKLYDYDIILLDLNLPDMSGFEVLEQIRADSSLSDVPVVVFTGRELSAEEDARLHTMARSIVVKGVESPERLLDETSLFLHRVVTELPLRIDTEAPALTTFDVQGPEQSEGRVLAGGAQDPILLHREDVHGEETDRAGEIDFIIAKNRAGGTGMVRIFCNVESATMDDIDVGHSKAAESSPGDYEHDLIGP